MNYIFFIWFFVLPLYEGKNNEVFLRTLQYKLIRERNNLNEIFFCALE